MDRIVLVTGGSRGIGAEICRKFIADGDTVILNYRNSSDEALKLKNELGEKLILVRADVGNREEVRVMADFILKEFNKIDILVNNAGISQVKPFADITDEDWDEMIKTNLTGVYNCTKALISSMIHEKKGRIINISSIWGEIGASCEVSYSAAKSGVIGFTKALAKEMGLSGIQVNCVAPGIIDTDMNRKFNLEELKEEVPMNKIGTSKDIADAVFFLASDEAKYITGQVISVNGGMC